MTRHQKTLHADQYQSELNEVPEAVETSAMHGPLQPHSLPPSHGLHLPEQPRSSNDVENVPEMPLDPSMWASVIDPSLSQPANVDTPYFMRQPDRPSISEHQPLMNNQDHLSSNGHVTFPTEPADEKNLHYGSPGSHERSQFG